MRNLQTKDLFYFSKILKKMNLKEELKGFFIDITGKSADEKKELKKDISFKLAITVIENLSLAEKEVYMFLGDLLDIKPEEVEKMPMKETMKVLQELFSQEEFGLFFSNAMQ